jgi:hypothetical protein
MHGASEMGIDRVTIETANELRRKQIGFSCPDYLWYVRDDDNPVYVARNTRAYSTAFVRSCDILIAMNGRKTSYEMDFRGMFEYNKTLIPMNILRLISDNGGPPAIDEHGNIVDAVAHFQERVYNVGSPLNDHQGSRDQWQHAIKDLCEIVTHVGRRVLPPNVGLEIH